MATRFAGSRAPVAGFDSTSGRGRDFSGLEITSGRVGSNAGSAADAVSLGSTFGAVRKNSPDFPGIATTGNETRSAERIAGDTATAQLVGAGISQYANVVQAQKEKEMMEERAAKAKEGAIFGTIAKVAGAGLSLATGGLGGGLLG